MNDGIRKVFDRFAIDLDISTASGDTLRKMATALGIDIGLHQSAIVDHIGNAAFHQRIGQVPPRPMSPDPGPSKWNGGANSNPIDDIRAAVTKIAASSIYGTIGRRYVSPSMGFSTVWTNPDPASRAPELEPAYRALARVWARFIFNDAEMDEVVALVTHYCAHQFEGKTLVRARGFREENGYRLHCTLTTAKPTDHNDREQTLTELVPRIPKPDKLVWHSKILTPCERADLHAALDDAKRSPLETDNDAPTE